MTPLCAHVPQLSIAEKQIQSPRHCPTIYHLAFATQIQSPSYKWRSTNNRPDEHDGRYRCNKQIDRQANRMVGRVVFTWARRMFGMLGHIVSSGYHRPTARHRVWQPEATVRRWTEVVNQTGRVTGHLVQGQKASQGRREPEQCSQRETGRLQSTILIDERFG